MADEDPSYLSRVRAMSCRACERPGPSEAHHRTGAGMAMRAHDHEAMPLCSKCHRDLHSARGHFRAMTRDELRAWQVAQVAYVQERLLPANDNAF